MGNVTYMLPGKSDILSQIDALSRINALSQINRVTPPGLNLEDRISRRLSRRLFGQKSTRSARQTKPPPVAADQARSRD